MTTFEAVNVALVAIKANKMRSLLTMLGIIIGVASVIAMIALGSGAGGDITEQVKAMGTNLLFVSPGASRAGPPGMGGGASDDNLKITDADAILEKCPSVIAVAPQVSGNVTVKWRNQNDQIQVVGTNPSYLKVNNHPVEKGRAYTEAESRGRASVCLIGTTVVESLFGRNDPIGETIRVKNISMKIIGVLKEKGGGGFRDPDDVIIVPLTVGMNRLFGLTNLQTISVSAITSDKLEKAITEITNLLRRRHKIRTGELDDFNIRGQTEILDMLNQTTKTFTILLAGIAALSLLVGGIGVMNIMLVSVMERTREIGIRKAVGARQHDIMMQFLIEALTLCLVGGLIGVLIGVILSFIVAKIAGWNTVVSIPAVLLAFSFSAVVGVTFGLYPAQRAAKLHPIDALRSE